jgi:uncharacterized membrane protein
MSSIQKISSIVLYIIAGISVIFAGMYYMGGSVPETIGTTFEEKNFTSIILIWAFVLFLIAGITTLIFSLVNVITNPKVVKSFLLVIALTIVLIVVSYVLASSEPLTNLSVSKIPTASTLKWVGAGLIATYILAMVAFLGIIVSEIYSAFK